jgi:hypothetical protein
MGYSLLKKDMKNIMDEFLEEYQDILEGIGDSSALFKFLRNTKQKYTEHKYNTFINSIEFLVEENIHNFIDEIKHDENKMIVFIECLHKAVDIDDTLQVYILASLVKSYNENGDFTYEELKLYNNINYLNEKDFTIFYCFYKRYILDQESRKTFSIDGEMINKDIVEVVIKNFITFNIFKDSSGVVIGEHSNVKLKIGLTKYTPELFNILDKYFKEQNLEEDLCVKFLPIDEEYKKLYRGTY